jgi:hypothetical protein
VTKKRNYALTLEYLETAFYEEVVKSGLFKGEELAVGLGRTEEAAAAGPQAGGNLRGHRVSGYNSAGPAIRSKEVLAAAGAIVQVEARHAAAIRLQNARNPPRPRSTRR